MVPRGKLQRSSDFLDRVTFDNVAGLEVLEILEAQTAFAAGFDFFDVILEMLEAGDTAFELDGFAANDADAADALEPSAVDVTAGDLGAFGELENLADFGAADDGFLGFGFEKAFHGFFNLVEEFIDDGVEFDLDVFAFGGVGDAGFGFDAKADDNGVGGAGKENIVFGDGADSGVDDFEFNLVVFEFAEGVVYGFEGTLDVGFEDDAKFFLFAFLYLREEVFELRSTACTGPFNGGGGAIGLLALLAEFAGFFFGLDDFKFFAGFWHAGKANDFDGNGGAGFFDAFAFVIDEGPYFCHVLAANEGVASFEGAFADEDGRGRTETGFHLGFDDVTFGRAFGVSAKFEHFCLEENHLQKGVDIFLGGRRDVNGDGVATPRFWIDSLFLKLFFNTVGIGSGEIALIDGNNDGNFGSFGVVDGFESLGHDAVIGGNNEDGNVGDFGAACAHFREGLVAWSVKKCDFFSVRKRDDTGADVLSDAPGFVGHDIGFADGVKQGCFAVVNVSHDDDDRLTGLKIFSFFAVFDFGFAFVGERGAGGAVTFFEFEEVATTFAYFSGNVFADGFIEVGEDVELHQVGKEEVGFDADALCEVAHNDGRFHLYFLAAVFVNNELWSTGWRWWGGRFWGRRWRDVPRWWGRWLGW